MKKYIIAFVVLLIAVFVAFHNQAKPRKAAGEPKVQSVIIMTAASAGDLMSEIAGDFKRETGIEVKVVTGGSNSLAAQIMAGAPADLFLSANPDWSNKVAEKGYVASSQSFLTNDLVLVVPSGNPGSVNSPNDLTGDKVHKIALAGDNVPCGKYAKQAFESLKIYDELIRQSKIVRGQDVRVALNFVEQGEVEAGVVYSTDAKISSKVQVVHLFDAKTFDPIVYPLVLLKNGEKNPSAVKFKKFLAGPGAINASVKYGFMLIEPSAKDN
jgi:molybdate transport system substrate-binding protein